MGHELLSHLEKTAMFTREHLQIWCVDKDAAVDVLQAVPAEVERLQAPQLVEYSWSEFLDLGSNVRFDSSPLLISVQESPYFSALAEIHSWYLVRNRYYCSSTVWGGNLSLRFCSMFSGAPLCMSLSRRHGVFPGNVTFSKFVGYV